jgi:uncharacterized protein
MKKIFFLLFITPCIIFAQPQIPILKQYANDYTSTLTNSELYTLNSTLKSFDDSTSNQVVFLMISTLGGYPLESYTYEVSVKNKIGTAKNNNGVLFFVAKDDRKMRIEVGYGLEGALPDALASSILRNEVRPYFQHDDYYSGIAAGINAIMQATMGEYTNQNKEKEKKGFKLPIGLIIMIFILISLFSRRGRGGGILPWLIIGSMMGGRGGRSWGGGGFGGFSGGGGSFGGGGASGSW